MKINFYYVVVFQQPNQQQPQLIDLSLETLPQCQKTYKHRQHLYRQEHSSSN